MSYMSFGDTLREARERQGLDINTVARELRLRPDILRAIEDCDINRMPQEGYSRNMIKAYARMLGLNASEVVGQYENELHGRQARGTRASAPTQSRSARVGRGRSLGSSARTTTDYTNFYSGPQAPNPLMSKLPLIIAGVIILVLLIVVLVLAFGSRGAANSSSNDTPKVQITGVTDTSQNDSASSSNTDTLTNQKLVAPTSVEVTYKIESSSYDSLSVIIQNDGVGEEQMVSVPSTGTATVTGTWTIACWAEDAVTVTVDGEKVEQSGTNDSGEPIWTVNFADYLAKWNEEHPGAAASTTTTTTNTATNSSTSTTGTTNSSSLSSDTSTSSESGVDIAEEDGVYYDNSYQSNSDYSE